MARPSYKRIVAFVLVVASLGLWSGCGAPSEGEVVVYAASSLTEAFQAIGAAFEEENPGVRVIFNFAGSAMLRTQLEAGARADVYASADERQMSLALAAGLTEELPARFATNSLVVAVSRESDAVRRLDELGAPGVKVVLALPGVPAGEYARVSLMGMDGLPGYGPDFSSRVLANVVSEETNVREVLAKVALGEADAGIVYATDVTALAGDRVRTIFIPDESNVIAVYPIVALGGGREPGLAREFIDYLLSPEGQAALREHGFGPPPEADAQ